MDYFISDLHFGHENCLAFDNRPFRDIEEQDEVIIENWNRVVTDEDTIYILGDVSFYDVSKTIEILKSLKGKKCLIIGNHDKKLIKNKEFCSLFEEITDYKELYLSRKSGIVLSHYPIPCFNKHYYGWYHLYGHVHSSFEWNMMERVKSQLLVLYDKPCEMFNVGAMMKYMNYTPRTLEEIQRGYSNEI